MAEKTPQEQLLENLEKQHRGLLEHRMQTEAAIREKEMEIMFQRGIIAGMTAAEYKARSEPQVVDLDKGDGDGEVGGASDD